MTEDEESTKALTQIAPTLDARHLRYAYWLAIPQGLREPDTRRALGAILGVRADTLSKWAALPEVSEAVVLLRKALLRSVDVPEVLSAMARAAVEDKDVAAAKLVLDAAGVLGGSAEAKRDQENYSDLTIRIGDEEITVQLRQATKG